MKKCFFLFVACFVLFLMYQTSMAICLLLFLLDEENKMEKDLQQCLKCFLI